MNITLSRPFGIGRLLNWLLLTAVIALLIRLFARKITQLSLPGLDVEAKTAVIDPQCPTPEQKEVNEILSEVARIFSVSFTDMLRTL